MSNPSATRCFPVLAKFGGKVHLYVSDYEITLQIRREVASVDSLVEPSYKVAVELTSKQAAELALQLLSASRTIRLQE